LGFGFCELNGLKDIGDDKLYRDHPENTSLKLVPPRAGGDIKRATEQCRVILLPILH